MCQVAQVLEVGDQQRRRSIILQCTSTAQCSHKAPRMGPSNSSAKPTRPWCRACSAQASHRQPTGAPPTEPW